MSSINVQPHEAENPPSPQEDPLIAALPPNTDYITYLTLLEYQLTPSNLPTLNRLLQEDDGTLASEIGWDLLKLVLPILRVNPVGAKQCLDIIARRGNPREVIVRVAEELERLCQDDSDIEADPTEREDGLPTFVGEAPHVHLGKMSLKGMPEVPDDKAPDHATEGVEDADASVQELKLQALLSMLANLHPRIKTQYPSRFLATSLPAALTAYRSLSMNNESTTIFLNTLTKLAGRKRPSLPPRVSTSDVLKSALLPDPEAKSESASSKSAVMENETAIMKRLLQAVLLEVVDEYTTASYEAQPPLTARLRNVFESKSLTSRRKAELETLTTNEEAKVSDSLKAKFVSTAKDLGLDIAAEIVSLSQPADPDPEAEEEHEYPTSPSQIPISASGLLLLLSAQLHGQMPSKFTFNSANLPALLEAIDQQYESDARLRQSAPAIDSILSILFLVFCTDLASSTAPTGTSATTSENLTRTDTIATESQTLLLAMHNILRDIFTTMPDPDLRDNAHHIASHLIHGHCRQDVRLKTIRSLLEADTVSKISPIHDAQSGNLKAIGVEWLKDEIFPTPNVLEMMQRLSEPSERGLKTSVVSEFLDLLFPVTKIPAVPTTTDGNEMDAFAAELPFYISSLNLLCLLAGHAHSAERDTQHTSDETEVLKIGGEFINALSNWRKHLVDKLATTSSSGQIEVEGISIPDIFAFDDACTRATEALNTEESS